MDYTRYLELFDQILQSKAPVPPYDKPDYHQYTRLNQSRMKRWRQSMQLDPQLEKELRQTAKPEKWIIITEPWCGDAAHSVPFLVSMTELSPLITLDIQLRDSPPYLIDSYLTGTSKSIPKLIVRNEKDQDLWTWGPRPEGAQALMNDLKARNAPFETIVEELQQWYNQDRGRSLCREVRALHSSSPSS